jgi:hypothetical protein
MSQPERGRGPTAEPVDAQVQRAPLSRFAPAGPGLDHAAVLRRLIDEATDARAALESVADQVGRHEGASARATARLQDRLRVGTGMLRALQVQLALAREAVADLERRSTELTRLQACLDETLVRAQRLVDAVESAEVNIAVVAHRAGSAARRAEAARPEGV